MKFEKEILRDYNELLKYVLGVINRNKTWLKFRTNTASPDDFINDGILKYVLEDHANYSKSDLLKCINSCMGVEEAYIQNRFSIDQTEYSTQKLEEFIPKGKFCGSGEKFNYYIDISGNLFRATKTGKNFKIIKKHTHSAGYIVFSLAGELKYSHRLVYETYKGKIPEGMEVHHKDHDKTNNHVDNLELTSHQKNMEYYFTTYCKLPIKKEPKHHRRFNGYYVVNGIKYESPYKAGAATGIHYKMVSRRCKNNFPGFSFQPTMR